MNTQIYSLFLLLIAMATIQSGSAVAKSLFTQISFESLTVLRVGFSALILSLIFKPWKIKLSLSQFRSIALYGFSLGAMNYFFYKSLQTTPVGIAVAIEFLGPLGVAVYYSRSVRDFVWVLCAGLGVYLVLPLGSVSTENLAASMAGPFYAAVAGLCWALYIIFGKSTSKVPGSSFQRTAWGMNFSFITVSVFAIFSGNGGQALDVSFWPIGILIAILSSALPYGLEMKALEKLPTKNFGVLMSLEPAMATLAGYLIIAEKITLAELSGILLVIIASVGTTMTKKN